MNDKEYNKSEARKLSRRRWQENHREKYNAYQRKYQKTHKTHKKYKPYSLSGREHWLLQQRGRWYYKTGRVIREPCQICGTKKNLWKVFNDPENPKTCLWLCKKHFLEVRRTRKQNETITYRY